MVKEFWFSLAGFIVTFGIMLLFILNPFSKHNPVPSTPQDKSSLSKVFAGYNLNFEDRESVESCLDEYKSKLEEYEIAIREAQNHLDGTYKGYADSCNEKVDVALEKLDIYLSGPSCY